MTRTTFQNRKPDGSPRVIHGWWRPLYQDVLLSDQLGGYRPTYHAQLGEVFAGGSYDRPVYLVDDDEVGFSETHCLILGTEKCSYRLGKDGADETAVARHAQCPEEARSW
jgi:hypothetical protein